MDKDTQRQYSVTELKESRNVNKKKKKKMKVILKKKSFVDRGINQNK